MRSYTAAPLRVAPSRKAGRAELVFSGVDLAGPSFEARVFLNNPKADETTRLTPEAGFAGSFYVYAYGEPAPPAVTAAGTRAEERSIAPIEKRLEIDEPALTAALEESGELTVTVVPIPTDPAGDLPKRPFESVDILFGRSVGGSGADR